MSPEGVRRCPWTHENTCHGAQIFFFMEDDPCNYINSYQKWIAGSFQQAVFLACRRLQARMLLETDALLLQSTSKVTERKPQKNVNLEQSCGAFLEQVVVELSHLGCHCHLWSPSRCCWFRLSLSPGSLNTVFFFLRDTLVTFGGSQARGGFGAAATSMPDLSQVCDLHLSSWQCQILNPLGRARDWTCILRDTSRVHFCWITMGAPEHWVLK